MQRESMNNRVLALFHLYLNEKPDFIDKEMMNEMRDIGWNAEQRFSFLLASAFQLDYENKAEDKEVLYEYLFHCIHLLDTAAYKKDSYYTGIRFPKKSFGKWSFTYEKVKPYEAFVFQDMKQDKKGRLLPQIGFFEEEYIYPAVLENDRLWMSVTPNEIETMKQPVENAGGKVLTFGLGLGYFAYMASLKENVSSVTVVERDREVISLFQEYLLPQFERKDKINLVKADAYQFAAEEMEKGNYDYVFTDLWHDPSDGVALYLKMKTLEDHCPNGRFDYWIEDTLQYYLP